MNYTTVLTTDNSTREFSFCVNELIFILLDYFIDKFYHYDKIICITSLIVVDNESRTNILSKFELTVYNYILLLVEPIQLELSNYNLKSYSVFTYAI